MTEIIIHHYAPSPVSEKIRTGMGVKKLAWRAVEQKRLPDRPELFAMTGGYRRIPLMQIAADIYCDTQCILRELERREPSPTFFANNGAGLPFALFRWTGSAVRACVLRGLRACRRHAACGAGRGRDTRCGPKYDCADPGRSGMRCRGCPFLACGLSCDGADEVLIAVALAKSPAFDYLRSCM